eukprot:TRINITY_DN5028_c0_g1_i1.p1 TRINITY_DN5028_c0_g1~~TRINITY_DN5028_c0_g1_i1.p1  ORF type:complete len:244 (+),score=11.65 TRINITY_DN5028_c0_g1_i1:83-814(+)
MILTALIVICLCSTFAPIVTAKIVSESDLPCHPREGSPDEIGKCHDLLRSQGYKGIMEWCLSPKTDPSCSDRERTFNGYTSYGTYTKWTWTPPTNIEPKAKPPSTIDLVVLAKKGGLTYHHVTLVAMCEDGFYEFGFYGRGKDGTVSATIDRYPTMPEHRQRYDVGQTQVKLSELIAHANSYRDLDYNGLTQNCAHFTKDMCHFAGVEYPIAATVRNVPIYGYSKDWFKTVYCGTIGSCDDMN